MIDLTRNLELSLDDSYKYSTLNEYGIFLILIFIDQDYLQATFNYDGINDGKVQIFISIDPELASKDS